VVLPLRSSLGLLDSLSKANKVIMKRAPTPPTTPPIMAFFLLLEPPAYNKFKYLKFANAILVQQHDNFDTAAIYIALKLGKDFKQNSPFSKKRSMLVVWLSAKKGVSEYLMKHPASIALPYTPGRQTFILFDAGFRQS